VASTNKKYYEGIGGRKTASARVRIYEGEGASVINGKPLDEYDYKKVQMDKLMRPIVKAGLKDKIYFSARVNGGGFSGQIDAIVLGIARAIVEMDPDKKPVLKEEDLLTRDSRKKERKKYFLRKARKRPQFSKR
jgi:small subunit ribosomal protein S9